MARKTIKEVTIRSSAAEYLTFVAANGDDKNSVEVRYEDENIWITQKKLAVLYEVETNTINYHIKKIFEDSELEEDSVIRNFRITASDGKSYDTKHYNLQMIIAVGFKVNSERAVQFRKWVNNIAKEYTIKGFAMDDERLKNDGSILTKKYFEEQLERIREIRSSERKFYQKFTDIYATAIDYDKDAAATKRFYATVQNKMHFAENMANRHIPLTMADWEKRLNKFIEMFEYGLLQDAGKVTAEIAKLHAETEFEKYRIVQDRLYKSDFDRFVEDEGSL